MKNRTLLSALPLLLICMTVLASCGGGGGGDSNGSCVDISGVWNVEETLASSTCASPDWQTKQKLYIIVQNGCSFTTTDGARNLSGSVSGNSVSWTGSYPGDSGGTITITGTSITAASDGNSMSGSGNWTWSNGAPPPPDCSGTTNISGTRQSNGPAAVDASGSWGGTWESSVYSGVSGSFTATITQMGSTLSGTINVPYIGVQDVGLKGSIQGTSITFGDIDNKITFTGNVSGNSGSGTYAYPSMSDTGTWQGSYTPPPPANSVTGIITLPKTGQTTSYAAGDDGSLQKGASWPTPRFTLASSGTGTVVTDELTGLMWTQDGNAPGPDACGPGVYKTWQAALDYVACLNINSYLTYTDWRLPNVNELDTLVNSGKADSSAWLNTQGFINVRSFVYWSATTSPYPSDTSYACYAAMDSNYINVEAKTWTSAVWPVRAGQISVVDPAYPANISQTGQITSYGTGTIDDGALQRGVAWPNPRFSVVSSGTGTVVNDQLTGLMWTQNGNAPGPSACGIHVLKTWQGALNYVACLNSSNYLGFTDWRLPNRRELRSLVNYGQSNSGSWLNTQGFSSASSSYWSSTTYGANTADAIVVNIAYGFEWEAVETQSWYVWPVRGGQ